MGTVRPCFRENHFLEGRFLGSPRWSMVRSSRVPIPADISQEVGRIVEKPVILSAVRTPIGRFLGGLKDVAAVRLGSLVVAESIRRAGLAPEDVDEVVLGNVISAGLGQNPARQAALGAGLPDTVAALTINKVCGSSLKAVVLGAQAVALGDAKFVVAGGMESMSNCPSSRPPRWTSHRPLPGLL